ncbi:uncharacterized protein LOC116292112 [Actinia tenebrosa]|uniref:Uncharacterized protein LOC116292112 n=1 Tax=Actinia tenebrosa TaxID=6105 RepID=A0A6P8HRB9_ACTTE|nr:uncharacterized protein LOC116292112 [Actinia tenebrosa]
MRRYALPDTVTNRPIIPRLVRDDIGVTAIPSVHAKSLSSAATVKEKTEAQSSRDRRMSLKSAKSRMASIQEEQEPKQNGDAECCTIEAVAESGFDAEISGNVRKRNKALNNFRTSIFHGSIIFI